MRFPKDVKSRALAHYQGHLRDLLVADAYSWSLPLHTPTAASAVSEFDRVKEFVRTWQTYEGPGVVQFEEKRWHRAGLGVQSVPIRLSVAEPYEMAELAGNRVEFATLERKLELIADGIDRDRVAALLPLWKNLPVNECPWVPRVVDWFRSHSHSELRPRAVAVEGVHGKWLEQHRELIKKLLNVDDLGLQWGDDLVRIRVLDPDLSFGLIDFTTPVAEATALWPDSGPDVAIVVENKETFLSLPVARSGWGRTVAVWGAGYGVGRLAHLSWLNACSRILYWGDLDAEGFAILHKLRCSFPNVESVLMSPAEVSRWTHLGVPDPGDSTIALPTLTREESEARRLLLTNNDIRIEQERIPWDAALLALDQTIRG